MEVGFGQVEGMAENSWVPELIQNYVNGVVNRENEMHERLRAETRLLPEARMQCHPDLAVLLGFLVRLTGARRVIEVGTFTGRSSMAMASALPEEGRLIACDVSEEWTGIARRYWAEAGVAGRIDLRLGPAAQTLGALLAEGSAGSFDFAFIDADKPGYDGYYEACLKLVRSGGLIVFDNMLWSGRVADESVQDDDTKALRAMNRKLAQDARIEACLLTVGDGVMLVRKR